MNVEARWLRQGRHRLLAVGCLLTALACGAARAGSYPERGRPVHLGLGGAAFAGGSVDAATGAFQLGATYGSVLSPARVPVAAGWVWSAQDNSPGPFGPGTFMAYDWFVQYDPTLGDYTLVGPGNRRFVFNTVNGNEDYTDPRDPPMLGAALHIPPPDYGAQKVLTWKNGTKWSFDGFGSDGLVSVVDRHGVSVIYQIYRDSTTGMAGEVLLSSAYSERYRSIYYHTTWPSTLVDSITINYDAGGTGSTNRTWNLAYDGSGRLSSVTAPDGGVTHYAWTTYTRDDGQVLPLLSTITTPRNNVVLTNQYDSLGRIIRETHADTGYLTASYPASIGANGTTTITDPRGNVSHIAYTWTTPPSSHTDKFGYHVDSTTDALGRQTQFAALQAGSNLDTRTTDYRSRVSTLGWDFTKGNLTSTTSPTASGGTATWNYGYDPTFSRVTSVTAPPPAPGQPRPQSTFTVNATTGDVTAVTDPRSNTTSITRNSFGDATAVTNALNQTSNFTYGTHG